MFYQQVVMLGENHFDSVCVHHMHYIVPGGMQTRSTRRGLSLLAPISLSLQGCACCHFTYSQKHPRLPLKPIPMRRLMLEQLPVCLPRALNLRP